MTDPKQLTRRQKRLIAREERKAAQRAATAAYAQDSRAASSFGSSLQVSDWIALVFTLSVAVPGMRSDDPWIWIVCFVVSACIATLALSFQARISLVHKLTLILGTWIIFGSLSFYKYRIAEESAVAIQRMAEENSLTIRQGIIYPGDLPRPASSCAIPDDAVAVFFGRSVAWVRGAKVTIFRIRNVPIIGAEISEQGLRISPLILYDDRGQVTAQISSSKFKVEEFGRGRMVSPNNLVVYDYKGREALNVTYLNRKTIVIKGTFYLSSKAVVSITDDEVRVPGAILRGAACFQGSGDETTAFGAG
ncbi:hypothetical protein [Bradyrhizobium sp. HKCCYLS20291]|uniref:hypothetical protein n=1 Tax=Bradyrhizobium sp. HKCCYLS20291 TaxID=3420766 RepID=UPI003EB98F53